MSLIPVGRTRMWIRKMSDIDEIRAKIKAVEFALRSFGDYENNEEERKNYLRRNFKEHPELRTYLRFTEKELKESLQEKENLLRQERNLRLGNLRATTDCTALRNALLNPIVEGRFYCLPDSLVFPVSEFEHDYSKANSKLLRRDFHKEIRLILSHIKELHRIGETNSGAVFFGPTGIGKSWCAMAVLMDELKTADATGRSVVYFNANQNDAYVFAKHRSVRIDRMDDGPNNDDIPELNELETVLIYDASTGAQVQLRIFNCQYRIFASPKAGNYKQVVRDGLFTFVCPSWTEEELKDLNGGCSNPLPLSELKRRFNMFGGSPRSVVSSGTATIAIVKRDAQILLGGRLNMLPETAGRGSDWPICLLKADFHTKELATTPEQAFEKYNEWNVQWTFSSDTACSEVLNAFNHLMNARKEGFARWIWDESLVALMHGIFFENLVETILMKETEDVEIKTLEEDIDDGEDRLAIVKGKKFVLPRFKELQHPKISEMKELKNLTDPEVLYRMPKNFPLFGYFNPPNNCFSASVGDRLPINLDIAVQLCEEGVDRKHQVNFVHVCPSNTFEKMETWQSFTLQEIVDGKPKFSQKSLYQLPVNSIQKLARMVQFCLRFKKF